MFSINNLEVLNTQFFLILSSLPRSFVVVVVVFYSLTKCKSFIIELFIETNLLRTNIITIVNEIEIKKKNEKKCYNFIEKIDGRDSSDGFSMIHECHETIHNIKYFCGHNHRYQFN